MKKNKWITNFEKRIGEILKYFYKDQPPIYSLGSIMITFILVSFVKLALVGVEERLYTGYFEYMVIALLLFIMLAHTPIKLDGWAGIMNLWILFGGVLWILNSKVYILHPVLAVSIYLFVGHLLYIIYHKTKKKIRRKKK